MRVVSNVCFFMQRCDGWLDADSISKLLVGIRGVGEDGIPPRVTRGSHFGREQARQSRGKRKKIKSVGDGKGNEGVGK